MLGNQQRPIQRHDQNEPNIEGLNGNGHNFGRQGSDDSNSNSTGSLFRGTY